MTKCGHTIEKAEGGAGVEQTGMEQMIKEMVLNLGADACGIAGIERYYGNIHPNHHPANILPGCQAVVVFLKQLPKGAALVSPQILYQQANIIAWRELDRIGQQASIEMEKLGGISIAVPSDTPYSHWDALRMAGQGVISLVQAGVFAGLGWRGRNTLLISPQFGTMINLGAVLTSLPLQSDDLTDDFCLTNCDLCITYCPVHALDGGVLNAKKCREYSIGMLADGTPVWLCARCRTVCPLLFGILE